MAQSQFHPDIVRMLMEYTSPEATAAGLRIFYQDNVVQVDEVEAAGSIIFEFYVQDAGEGDAFGTGIEVLPDGQLDSECSCPNIPCAHEAAAIFYLANEGRLRLNRGDSDEVDPQAEIPAWQRALDSVLPPVLAAEEKAPEVCLFFSAESGSLQIRPGQPGKRGWIKGKAKWDALYTLRCSRQVRGLLQELYDAWRSQFTYGYGWGYGYQADWLPLENLAIPRLWNTLVQLRDAGVALVSWEGRQPVELASDPASVRIAVSQAGPDKGIELRPELRYGDAPAPREAGLTHIFLGVPATVLGEVWQGAGAKTQSIRIRPLAEPIQDDLLQLFIRQQTLEVEPEHRTEFESRYLPRLQQLVPVESPDNSYQPPQPQPGVLNLRVTPVTVEADKKDDKDTLQYLHLQWKWDRGPLGIADSEHEDKVLAAVQDAGAAVTDQRLPREKAVPFLANTLPRLEQLDHVRVTRAQEVPEFRQATDSPQVSVGMSAGEQDWFDLQVEVSVGGEQVSFAELFTALSQDQEIFVLPSGTYFNLDTPELDQLRRIIEEAKTLNDTTVENLKVSRYQVDLWEELVETGIVDAQEHEWWSRIQALAAEPEQPETALEVPASLDAELRDYQKSGYRWLETLRRNDLGGVLADDMGLGKTLQVIAMITAAFEQQPEGAPFLVIAPTSVVGNWVRETEKFAPHLKPVAIEGTAKKRGLPLPEVVNGAHVVVTSYTLFRLESEAYGALDWSAAIFDEAQMIKNHSSAAYKNARLLDVPFKLAVTGTPMENNLMELWSLVSLTSPGLLGGRTHFTEFYRNPIEKEKDGERLELLQRRMRPFLLRRTKELVAADLPEKTENVLEVDLYPKHRRIYDRRLQRERQKVLGLVDDLNSNRFEVFRSLTLLRQLALDCELADEEAAPSAKLDALADMLASVTSEGHRVLVLSQFTRFLSKARDAATAAGIDNLYLDGKTRGRQKLIDQFRDGKASAFFISLKAGGFGLNLTEADYVVLLDPWWNPATEAQAVDRAHRIGQTRQVMVYRLVARDTIESKVMELKKSKAALFDRVLEGGGAVESEGLGVADIKALME